ncbi:MAG: hypothetical protein AB1401_00435 [Thermodesulfobacteriota bacterium]
MGALAQLGIEDLRKLKEMTGTALGAVYGLEEGKVYGTRRSVSQVKASLATTGRQISPSQRKFQKKAKRDFERIKTEFSSKMFNGINDFAADKITHTQASMILKDAIRIGYENAYVAGMEAVGNFQGLYPEDIAWLKGARQQEFRYLNRFIDDVKSGNLKMPLEDRMQMYVDTLNFTYDHARVESSPDNVMIVWNLQSFNPCPDCIERASGSPYTKETLPSVPRDGSTRCLSRCYCSLTIRTVPIDKMPPAVVKRPTSVPAVSPVKTAKIPSGYKKPSVDQLAKIDAMIMSARFYREMVRQVSAAERVSIVAMRKKVTDELADYVQDNMLFVPPRVTSADVAVDMETRKRIVRRSLTGAALIAMTVKEFDRYLESIDEEGYAEE